MRELTIELEDNHLEEDQFVLWGGYTDRADYLEHEIEISETICGFVPAVWLRTELFGGDGCRIEREWTRSVDELIHRSGLSFPNTGSSVVDSAMFHPLTAELAIVKLYKAWEDAYEFDVNSLQLPVFRWTPSRVAERIGSLT